MVDGAGRRGYDRPPRGELDASLKAGVDYPHVAPAPAPWSGARGQRAVAAVRAAQHGFWRFEEWIFRLKAEATSPATKPARRASLGVRLQAEHQHSRL